MKNAHERFGSLEFTKRVKDTTTRIRVHMDRLIAEPAKGDRGSAIEIWKTLREDPQKLKRWYSERWHAMMRGNKVEQYERIKAHYNAKPNGPDLLFLSRACYGGVVRFRKADGYMSTPCGIHDPISPTSFARRVDEWDQFWSACIDPYDGRLTPLLLGAARVPGADRPLSFPMPEGDFLQQLCHVELGTIKSAAVAGRHAMEFLKRVRAEMSARDPHICYECGRVVESALVTCKYCGKDPLPKPPA